VKDSVPLNETFFLSADISSFKTNVDSPSGYGQWTLWGVCGATTGGKNVNCPSPTAAYPFNPAENFGNSVPAYFINNQNFFFYTSRFMFAFYIIAVTFATFSLFTGLLALCSRLGSAVSSVFAMAALVIDLTAASLMTAVYVKGRNEFNSNGITASLGVKAFSFAWTSVVCLLLATFGFCCVACGPGKTSREHNYSGPSDATRTSRFWRRRNRKTEADAGGVAGTY